MHPNQLSDDVLEWVWAYREQIAILDAHDAAWIREAKIGWPDDSQRYQFLTSYGLLRGSLGHHAGGREDARNREWIWDKLNPIFGPPLIGNRLADATERWKKAIEVVKPRTEHEHPSFTLKLFWFYHPNDLTMYDRQARSGPRDWLGHDRWGIPEFLSLVNDCRAAHQSLIDKAAELSNREYPYSLRVVDKWLWLRGLGSEGKGDVLRKFRASLDLVPFQGPRRAADRRIELE